MGAEMSIAKPILLLLRTWFVTRARLTVENLALRQQLAVMRRSHKRPKLRPRDRLSLERNSPMPREIEPPSQGDVISIPQVGGLHHRYTRAA